MFWKDIWSHRQRQRLTAAAPHGICGETGLERRTYLLEAQRSIRARAHMIGRPGGHRCCEQVQNGVGSKVRGNEVDPLAGRARKHGEQPLVEKPENGVYPR